MKTFDTWLNEMANVFPIRKGDTNERAKTTHMGIPVWAPTMYNIIMTRDQEKYPLGMTAREIAEELLQRSEKRDELRPDETPASDNWKDALKSNWTSWVRGITSNLNRSVTDGDMEIAGTRQKGDGKGKAPSIFHPTAQALTRQGGAKFLKKPDRLKAKVQGEAPIEAPKEPGTPITQPSAPPEPSIPTDIEEKDVNDVLKGMFQ